MFSGGLVKDFLFKLWILILIMRDGITGAFNYWKAEIYRKDLDNHACCSGHLCACCGVTIREEWSLHCDKTEAKDSRI